MIFTPLQQCRPIMLHFIWVFAVRNNTCLLGVTSIQRVNRRNDETNCSVISVPTLIVFEMSGALMDRDDFMMRAKGTTNYI